MKKPRQSIDPYAELGVPKTADSAAVKRAYRRRAKRAHPDAGGDAVQFNRLQIAYELLSDEDRRRRYDETGETEASPTVDAAFSKLAQLVLECIGMVSDPSTTDILDLVLKHCAQKVAHARKGAQGCRDSAMRLRRTAERFTRKDGGDSVLSVVVAQQAAMHESAAADADKDAALHERVAEIAREYSYRVDKREAPFTMTVWSDFIVDHGLLWQTAK